jgi:hypothetical protein
MSNNDLIKRIDELEGTVVYFGKLLAELYMKAGLNRGSIEMLTKAMMQVADKLDEDTEDFDLDAEIWKGVNKLQLISGSYTHVEPVTKPKTKHACSCGESDCVWCG